MNTATSVSEALYSTLGGDPDLGKIVELFVDEMVQRTDNFSNLFEKRDWEGLRRSAHQLKGAAGSYGFDPISVAAGQLEDVIYHQEPEDDIRREVDTLVDLCHRACAGSPR